jgi:metalloendopeptidase OMA1, mitochondrial
MIGVFFICQGCSKDSIVHPASDVHLLDADTAPINRRHEVGNSLTHLTRDSMRDPVLRVFSRLITAARRSEHGPTLPVFEWEITICEDETVLRTFVHPDGAITVCSGAFRIAETEAGLAALLGHELAHALKHCTTAAQELCRSGGKPDATHFTLEQEMDADGVGMNLMADAGYDPTELLRIWKRMKQSQQKGVDALLVHVTYDRRMAHIKGKLPDALRLYAGTNRAPQRALPIQ